MFSPVKRTSRSVDYLLSVLSPLDVSRATRRYLDSLDPAELDGLIERSKARMTPDERAYLGMVGDFATFLEQNRRSLTTLDPESLRAILLPVIASEPGEELIAHLREALPRPAPRLPVETARRSARALATALVIVGSGLAAVLLLTVALRALATHRPAAAVPQAAAPARVAVLAPHHAVKRVVMQHRAPAPAAPRRTIVHTAAHRPAVRATPARPAARRPAPRPSRVVATARAPVPRRPVYRRPAASRRPVQRPRLPHVRIADAGIPASEPRLVQRARLIVMSYLDSLMRGDASAALGNLGLSASAGTSNLTEAPILAGATEFRVVRASQTDAKDAKVQVVIDGPQGRYFGDYIVSANGPAAWITEHEVIPVEKNAAPR